MNKVKEIPRDVIAEQELLLLAFLYGKPGGDSKFLYDYDFLDERYEEKMKQIHEG